MTILPGREGMNGYAREGVGSVRGRDGRPLRARAQAQSIGGVFAPILGQMQRKQDWNAARPRRAREALQPRLYGLDDLAGPGGYAKLEGNLRARLDLLDGPGRRLSMVVLDRVLNGELEEPPLDLDFLAQASEVRRDRIEAQVKAVGAVLGWAIASAAGERRIVWADAKAARRFLALRAERCRRVAPLAGLSSRRRAQMRKFLDVDPRHPEHEQLLDWLCLEWMSLHRQIQEKRQELQGLGINVGDDPIDPDGSEAAKRAANGYGQTPGSVRKRLMNAVLYLKGNTDRARQLWADDRVKREMTLFQTWCWVSFRSIRDLMMGTRLPDPVPELLLDAGAVRRRAALAQVRLREWEAAQQAAEAEPPAEWAAPAVLLPVELERAIEGVVAREVKKAAPAPAILPDVPFPGAPREPEPEPDRELDAEKRKQLEVIEALVNERKIAHRQEMLVRRELAEKDKGRSRWSTAPPGG